MRIRSTSLLGPSLLLLAFLICSFFAGVSATGGRRCVNVVKSKNQIGLGGIETFTWVRVIEKTNFAAVVFDGPQGKTTGVCYFKGDTHVIESIQHTQGNVLTEVRANSRSELAPF